MTITRISLLLVIISAGVILTLPLFAHAIFGASTVANPTCVACVQAAIKAKRDPYTTCKPMVCVDSTYGVVKGHCELTECHADSFSGAGQGGGTGLDQVMKALGDLFGKLMSQPPAPPAPPSTPPTSGTGATGCQGKPFQTSDISRISDPCAQYTPPVSTNITPDTGSCSPLSESLGMCTNNPNSCPNVPAVDCAPGSHAVSGGQDANGCVLKDTCAPDIATTASTSTTPSGRVIFATSTGTVIVPPGGARGDINTQVTGATVIGGARDTQSNVEVAGFYGSETFNGGSQGLVGAWCKDRPWASNFLSKIITPTFFDNLCTSRGYKVGTPPPSPAVVLQQTPKPKPATVATTTTTTTAATTTPGVTPKVDIWAVPASVPLGGRTSIFWNTQGVTNCTETSPNGGFSQSSLSGGAATQPITAPTTFSISCLAPDGSHVTGSVTVNLKI